MCQVTALPKPQETLGALFSGIVEILGSGKQGRAEGQGISKKLHKNMEIQSKLTC